MIRTAPSSIGFEQTWLSHAAQADRLQVCFSLYSIQCEIDHSLAIIQSGEPAMKWPDVRKVSPWVWDQGNGLWFSNQWQLGVELKSGTLLAFLLASPIALTLMIDGGLLGSIGVLIFPQIPWVQLAWLGGLVGKFLGNS
jgi:hypothetical protein